MINALSVKGKEKTLSGAVKSDCVQNMTNY